MKQEPAEPHDFPLGAPTNRKPEPPAERPIPGRPGWYTDRAGVEHYRQPPGPTTHSDPGGSKT